MGYTNVLIMGYTNVLINGSVMEALINYRSSGIYIGFRGVWTKASWNDERKMWSVTVG